MPCAVKIQISVTTVNQSTQLDKTLEASLQAMSMSSNCYPADVPTIV